MALLMRPVLCSGTSVTVNFIRWNTATVVDVIVDGVTVSSVDLTLTIGEPYDNANCTLASVSKAGLAAANQHNVTVSGNGITFDGFLIQSFE